MIVLGADAHKRSQAQNAPAITLRSATLSSGLCATWRRGRASSQSPDQRPLRSRGVASNGRAMTSRSDYGAV